MRIKRAGIAARCATVLVSSGLVVGLAAPPATAARGWTRTASPHVSKSNERINAIAVPAAGDVWAIGYSLDYVGGNPEFRMLAEHSTGGGAFKSVPIPGPLNVFPRDFLRGAAGIATNDVWAVGTSVGLGFPNSTLVEHWNGVSWSAVNAPNPGGSGNDLEAVSATSATDMWAVGARIDSGSFYQVPMTMHWNGLAWTVVAAPNPPGCSGHSYLTAVDALRPGSVWAAGWCGSGGSSAERGFVLHWNGIKWSVAYIVPQETAPGSEVYGIAAKGNSDIWIVGTFHGGVLASHYDGTAWTKTAVPPSVDSLAGVTIGSRGVWAVGTAISPQPPFAGPGAISWDGAAWTDRSPKGPDFGRLNAVTTTPDARVWAVGQKILPVGDDTALLLHR